MIPRNEYPRPQLVRDNWLNLNGEWDFAFDFGKSGIERGLHTSCDAEAYPQKILVPFCPESKLSGINYTDFMPCVWYRRKFTLPAGADTSKGSILAHFGAVDYFTRVYVNGRYAGCHRGGYTPFEFNITKYLHDGENILTVCAEDDGRSGRQARGKQCPTFDSRACDYTRTTGIWQTVWLEYVPPVYISSLRMTPDVPNSKLDLHIKTEGAGDGLTLVAEASYAGNPVGKMSVSALWRSTYFSLSLSELHLWQPLDAKLYDIKISLYRNSELIDSVSSYFGMRSISLTDSAILINGKPVFQRLILDQGFYPDGIYTAPSDDELKADIQRSLDLGFNGARLHQKVFEPRFLYWSDQMGYLCWDEHANWGLDISKPENLLDFQSEWTCLVERDFNHPSIVGWCPFNETASNQDNRVISIIYNLTKSLDASRPVIDTSGWVHHLSDDRRTGTDIFDVHDYDQNPDSFKMRYAALLSGDNIFLSRNHSDTFFSNVPYFVSEFGGTWWAPDSPGWGYGQNPKSEAEFIERYRGLVYALLDNPKVCAFCYTQLTDIEQEVNGLYYYNRTPKFNTAIIKEITSRKAAIETI